MCFINLDICDEWRRFTALYGRELASRQAIAQSEGRQPPEGVSRRWNKNGVFGLKRRAQYYKLKKIIRQNRWQSKFQSAAARFKSWMPDFSRYNIPKREKYTKNHKIYQNAAKYTK
jgi:hypothetical protein